MKRRLLFAGVLIAALGGGLATSASAGSPETTRHKVCVMTPGNDPIIPGYCVTFVDPLGP